MRGHPASNALFAAAITVCLILVPRASQPIAALLVVAALATLNDRVPISNRMELLLTQCGRAFRPSLVLFVAASGATIFTAYAPLEHVGTLPKILGLQIIVLSCYYVGRLVTPIDRAMLTRWMLGISGVSTILLAEEQMFGLLHLALFSDNSPPVRHYSLNRSFLLISFVLAYLLVETMERRERAQTAMCLTFIAIIIAVSTSEAAKLVVATAMLFACVSRLVASYLMTTAVVCAVVVTLIGPYLYGPLFDWWKYWDLASLVPSSFDARMVGWANFSRLILDSAYLGRGLDVSKVLAADHSVYVMPHAFRAAVPYYPWHPHNAGLQVVTDLGLLGAAWLSTVLWQLRGLIISGRIESKCAVVAVATAFLLVSFVADGLWQTWWWMTVSILALALGLLTREAH